MPCNPGEPEDQLHLDIVRDTIRGSGAQGIPLGSMSRPGTSLISGISDAGDQQFKRQKQDIGAGSTSQERLEPISDVSYNNNYPTQHELNCQLFTALQQTRDAREKGFLPKKQLVRLINPRSVCHELFKFPPENMTSQEIQELANTVCTDKEIILSNGKKKIKSFRQIFALLVLVEKSSSISLLIKEDVSDLDLPLSAMRSGGLFELRRKNTRGMQQSKPLECFRSWSPVRRKEFEEYQWTMLAPFFGSGSYNNVSHYTLTDRHILPFFCTKGEEDCGAEERGGFGTVFMVRIHSDHHNFGTSTHPEREFAIKQLLKNDPVSFKREVDILKKFVGEGSHPHIVSLLATYEQFDKFHLIFHRAEGNLFKYWETINPYPEFNYRRILWMAKQCAGIAQGLLKLHKHNTIITEEEFKRLFKTDGLSRAENRATIVRKDISEPSTRENQILVESEGRISIAATSHSSEKQTSPSRQPTDEKDARLVNEPFEGDMIRQWGRHGDLKPENILWFGDSEDGEGCLKISDFGEAELNSRASKSGPRERLANSMTYRPPECDLQPKIIRQSYDIWCLGCVYMEFVTWMLGGVELWQEFAGKRLTWDIFQSNNSDAFFEVVRNDMNDISAMVKKVVTEVSRRIRKGLQGKRSNMLFSFTIRYTRIQTAPTIFIRY